MNLHYVYLESSKTLYEGLISHYTSDRSLKLSKNTHKRVHVVNSRWITRIRTSYKLSDNGISTYETFNKYTTTKLFDIMSQVLSLCDKSSLLKVYTLLYDYRFTPLLTRIRSSLHSLAMLCTFWVWRFRQLDRLKVLIHTKHLYGFSPVWTLLCSFSSPDLLNALSHTWL